MTVQDIINKIERNDTWTWFSPEELAVIKSELEKQIPKKVQKLESKILIADGWQYKCPKCKCAVGINQHAEEQTQEDEYCPTCGQALKWGEEDD